MKKRILGKTGAELSIIGFGGIIVRDVTSAEAARYVGEAIDRGVNYFDISLIYGNAPERLGSALKPYRNESFLACKTLMRDAKRARSNLEQSLKTLQTDYFDLYQFHGIEDLKEARQILAPGGALETVMKAQKDGKIRHIGFSTHIDEVAVFMLDQFPFDSVLFPVNIFCWNEGKTGPDLIRKAVETETGILAIKSLAKRPLEDGEKKKWGKSWYVPIDTMAEAAPALAFTLSKPVTSVIPPGHIELFRMACDALNELGNPPWEIDETAVTGQPIF